MKLLASKLERLIFLNLDYLQGYIINLLVCGEMERSNVKKLIDQVKRLSHKGTVQRLNSELAVDATRPFKLKCKISCMINRLVCIKLERSGHNKSIDQAWSLSHNGHI